MKKILAVAVATAISAPAMADLTIGASTEFNLSTTDGVASESIETNVTFTGSTTMENGSFAKAFIELEAVDGGNADTALDIDDNYLQIGNAAANVVVGYFGTKSAFISGDDSFEAGVDINRGINEVSTIAPENLYKGNSDDDADDQEIALNITSIEGVDLQVSGNINDASDTDMRAYAGLTLGGVALAANIQSSDTPETDGYALSATTDLAGATVSVSYATNDVDDSATALTANMNGFDVTYVRFEDGAANTSETSYYGSYALGNMGIDGLSVDVGAGSGSDRETKMGVEVIYSF
jgi:hypothetical protein